MSQSHLPPEEPHLSSEAPPQEGPAASQNPAPPAEDTAAQKAGKEKKPGAFGADLYGWLQALTFALAFILIFFTFFGRVIGVDGHSMDPTLNDRDMLFLQCIAYEPKQGDVVVLHKDFGDVETPIVKRVIAVEGQTVDIDFVSGAVYVDGKTWTARSADGSVLPAGSRVEIRRMEGVKLIVEAAQKAPDKKEEVV